MKDLVIIIERSKDHFGAYAESYDSIYAAGNTIEEVKKDVQDAIEILKTVRKEKDLPEILKGDYRIVYKYDTISFLKYYSNRLSLSGLEAITGVNQGQLSHYITGRQKPRKETVEKIQKGIRRFAEELNQVELVY